jgi:hypothetical protein
MFNNTINQLFNAIANSFFSTYLNFTTSIDEDLKKEIGDLLSLNDIQKAFNENNCSFGNACNAFYTPILVFMMSILQMLSTGTHRSYSFTVRRLTDIIAASGLQFKISANTGAFAVAKNKICESVPYSIIRLVAQRAETAATDTMLFLKRRNIFFVDGTTFDLFDSSENQQEYPQPKDQKEGCGFPKIRATILTSFTTGMVYDVEHAAYSGKGTGELT